ncbi:MAG: single-stranded DNA-binding protein, partial [Solirubrobacteraceae bacterium]
AIAGGQRTIELVSELDAGQATGRPQSSGPWIGHGPQPPERGSTVNRYQCTGRLVDDPVLRHTSGGKDVCEMRLAVDGMAPGNETGFLNVSQFGAGGVAAANTLTKGWLVGFDGRLEHHTWKDRDSGQNRQSYVAVGNVEFLAAPRGHNGDRAAEQTAQTAAAVGSDAEVDSAPGSQQTPPQTRPRRSGSRVVGAAAVATEASDDLEF